MRNKLTFWRTFGGKLTKTLAIVAIAAQVETVPAWRAVDDSTADRIHWILGHTQGSHFQAIRSSALLSLSSVLHSESGLFTFTVHASIGRQFAFLSCSNIDLIWKTLQLIVTQSLAPCSSPWNRSVYLATLRESSSLQLSLEYWSLIEDLMKEIWLFRQRKKKKEYVFKFEDITRRDSSQ